MEAVSGFTDMSWPDQLGSVCSTDCYRRYGRRLGSQRIENPAFVVSDGARELEALARCAVIAGGRERKLVADLKRGVDDVMR